MLKDTRTSIYLRLRIVSQIAVISKLQPNSRTDVGNSFVPKPPSDLRASRGVAGSRPIFFEFLGGDGGFGRVGCFDDDCFNYTTWFESASGGVRYCYG
jgi:hypothetical protein